MPSVYFDQDERGDAYCLVEHEDGTTQAFLGERAYELWQRTIERGHKINYPRVFPWMLERGPGSDDEGTNR